MNKLQRGMAFVLVLVSIVGLAMCTGTTTTVQATGTATPSGGDVGWTVSVGIGIQIARQVIPPLRAVVDAQPGISSDARGQIGQALTLASDSLAEAGTVFSTIGAYPTVTERCRLNFVIERAIQGTLQALTLLRDAGVTVPTPIEPAVEGLGVISDMLWPGCAATDAGVRAARQSAQERVQAAIRSSGGGR